MTSYNAGDVKINQLLLTNLRQDKSLSILDQVMKIDIYESIMSPIIFGNIVVFDAIELKDKFPITIYF